jgi:hypothetical protein
MRGGVPGQGSKSRRRLPEHHLEPTASPRSPLFDCHGLSADEGTTEEGLACSVPGCVDSWGLEKPQ